MCGVTGIVERDRERPVPPHVLDGMTDLLAHRGPDGRGVRIWGNVGLGHRRLAVIDGEGGVQPMGRDGCWISYNGELYNYRELRARLGGEFRTASDTEVLLALYLRHGLGMFEHMNGQFAFALYDRMRQRLVLARDRFGEKPLYWYRDDEVVLFASEIKALLAHPRVSAEIDEQGLEEYLAFQHTLGDRTLFRGIRRLEPASYLVLSETGDTLDSGRYWELPAEHRPERPSDQGELAALVEDAVRLRLRSDVPIGAYLSGGLDSSLVSSLAGPVPLFTGTFAEGGVYDELEYAAAVAERSGGRHFVVCPTADDFAAQLHDIVWHLDEPAAGPGAFGQWNVSRLAAEHVRVVLGGQGGDEVFGGYARHAIIGGGSTPPGYEELERKAYCAMVARGSGAVTLPQEYSQGGPTPLARATSWDARTQLQALLHVEDRMSMAHSLESRLPLLDHRIAELVFSLPDSFRHRGGRPKGALLAVADGVVPRAVLARSDKRGFPIPFVEWAQGPLRDFVGDLLGETGDGRSQFDRELWGRLCLAVWRHTFVDTPIRLAA